jgi:AcrR family transcriptional regulator
LSKSLWSGNRPKNNTEAKSRVCKAALECLKRLGLEKTTMTDIAKEAGISRPTLYKYFRNKDEVFFTIEERIVATIIYVVEELPKDRNLSYVLNHELAGTLRSRAFSDEATLVFSEMTALPLIEIRPELADQGVEISEIMARFAISMILFPGKYSNDYDGLRSLIKTRILPGLI